MNTIREVEAQKLATDLGLPLHTLDTFRGWEMPKPDEGDINLIIAVSFGLWIPSRLLNQSKYGGLNVHPSLLPDLRGAAPIHHTILHGLEHTGVTLQTLSTVGFDQGVRLLQLPESPGLPVPKDATVESLIQLVSPLGADMLVKGLEQGLHVPPYENSGWWKLPRRPPQPSKKQRKLAEFIQIVQADIAGRIGKWDPIAPYRLAPKITKDDQRIVWTKSWTAEQLLRQYRACGSLWTRVVPQGEERAPFVHPLFRRTLIRAFVGTLNGTGENIPESVVRKQMKDRKFIEEAVNRGRQRKKKHMKMWKKSIDKDLKGLEASRETPMTSQEKKEEEYKMWLAECIEYYTPKVALRDSELFDYPEALIPYSEQDLMENKRERVVAFFETALRVLQHFLRMKECQNSYTRVIFSEPEPLSPMESRAVRKRFVGRDIGIQGVDPSVSTNPEDMDKIKAESRLGPIGLREPMKWIHWADPIQKGRNQRDMGGRRNKETKIERRQRKAAGIEKPDGLDDIQVKASSWGQVWLEDDYPLMDPAARPDMSEKDAEGFGDFKPEMGKGNVLIPDTSSSGGVFRIRLLKAQGMNWEPAAKVLDPYLIYLDRTKVKKHPANFVKLYEGVALFSNSQKLDTLRMEQFDPTGRFRKAIGVREDFLSANPNAKPREDDNDDDGTVVDFDQMIAGLPRDARLNVDKKKLNWGRGSPLYGKEYSDRSGRSTFSPDASWEGRGRVSVRRMREGEKPAAFYESASNMRERVGKTLWRLDLSGKGGEENDGQREEEDGVVYAVSSLRGELAGDMNKEKQSTVVGVDGTKRWWLRPEQKKAMKKRVYGKNKERNKRRRLGLED
ncbi:methionyl-tRNA formyltransferase-like protein [Zalerion maritima]|uniref:Methionyl-tRNA formyltransferase-like protein n=1 Tax=Zalerion maritima TaxID=339359 RepID=A0AAD5WPR9_9PEZI|nr:methionyl-tRNA formyltransferase-like protein [Zalerion maritima]